MSETEIISGLPKTRATKRDVELKPARVFQCVNFECGCMFQDVLRGDVVGLTIVPCYAHTEELTRIRSMAEKALGSR